MVVSDKRNYSAKEFMSGFCPDCGNTMCLCDEVTKATYPFRFQLTNLQERNKELEAELKFSQGAGKLMGQRLDEFEKKLAEAEQWIKKEEGNYCSWRDGTYKAWFDRIKFINMQLQHDIKAKDEKLKLAEMKIQELTK